MATSKKNENVEIAKNASAVSEATFPLETLQKHCVKLFGVPTVTFAGATAELEARNYTVSELKSIITKWCGKAVK